MSLLHVIKYEGDNQTLVYKHPQQDFTTLSQLVVHQSQKALLMLQGQALDLFEPGTYTMHTGNIPLLNRLINLPFGGESPFHCEVYFINMAEHMAVPWGVGDIIFRDMFHKNYPFRIGANGEMSLTITDPRKLVVRLVGTERALDHQTIGNYFRTAITQEIKNILPKVFQKKQYSIFDLETDLSETSEVLKTLVSVQLEDYGVSVERFWINGLKMPEEDPTYRNLLSLHGTNVTIDLEGELRKRQALIDSDVQAARYTGEVRVKQMDAEAEKYRRKLEAEADQYEKRLDTDAEKYAQQTLGYTWKEKQQANVMQGLADNEGSGSDIRNGLFGASVGLGIGGAVGGMFSETANEFFQSSAGQGAKTREPDPWDSTFPGEVELKEDPGFGEGSLDASGGAAFAPDELDLTDSGQAGEPEAGKSQVSRTEPAEKISMEEFKEKVEKLAFMREAGLLTEEEFEEEKKALRRLI